MKSAETPWGVSALSEVKLLSNPLIKLGNPVSIPYIDNGNEEQNPHCRPKAGHPLHEKAESRYDNSACNQGNTAEPLAFLPGDLVFHAPRCPQADPGVHPQLGHDIPDDDHGQTQSAKNQLVDLHLHKGKGLCRLKRGIKKIACYDIEEEQSGTPRDQAYLFVVLPVLLPLGAEPGHTQHKKAEENRNGREQQRFVFASPPGYLTIEIIMGGNLCGQEGKRGQNCRQGQEHKDIQDDSLPFHVGLLVNHSSIQSLHQGPRDLARSK